MSDDMSKISLDPYLFFTGNCREAMEFYKSIFGGELFIQTFKDAHMGNDEDAAKKIMHASLTSDEIKFMASDGDRQEPYQDCRITLSLSGWDEAKLTKYFQQLSEDGKVTSELKKESWGDIYGSLTDKFGIDWMININAQKS